MKVLRRIMSIVLLVVVCAGCTNNQGSDKSDTCQHSVQIGYCPECGEYVTTLSSQFSTIKDSFKKALNELDLAEQDFVDYKDDTKNKSAYASGKQHMKNVKNALKEARDKCGDYEEFQELKNDFVISIKFFGGEKSLQDYVDTMVTCVASLEYPAKRIDALNRKSDNQPIKTMEPLYDENRKVCVSSNELKISDEKIFYMDINLYDYSHVSSFRNHVKQPYVGESWKGECKIEVYSDKGKDNLLFSENLSIEEDNYYLEFYKDGLNAGWNKFDLCFDDYNNDGNFEFVLGQFLDSHSTNGYAMYTINSDTGEVTKVDTEGIIFNDTPDYSIKLNKESDTSFVVTKRNLTTKKDETTVYTWKGNKFVKKLR